MTIFISEKKREASRRNGRLGKGPITIAGKKNSRMNALKHGLLSKEIVVKDGRDETEDEYQELLRHLIRDVQPVGIQEELLVETIAVSFWRKRRALRAESAEITFAKQTANWKNYSPAGIERGVEDGLRMTGRQYQALQDDIEIMKKKVLGNGFLSKGELQGLEEAFPVLKEAVTRCRSSNDFLESALNNKEHAGDINAYRNATSEALELLCSQAERWCTFFHEQAEKVETARITTKDIPGNLVVERIARYEAAIDRQLYRAMAMLQHLQSRRRGDAVAHLAP